uniref:hypothetical protein n=1 Tax=Rigidoporus microporus TaxID=219653 RepID=UPI002E76F831|nr:hypothetical protein V2420_mgp29 [Rigidoporus microporus]WPS66282.1 hypothetical protein [Rigidoporus microporus]
MMNPMIFQRPIYYLARGILVRVMVRRNRELMIPILTTLFNTSLSMIQHLGLWTTIKLFITMNRFTGVSFKEVLSKLQHIFTSDVFSVFHRHLSCSALPTLWDTAIKLNNFKRFYYGFLIVTFIGNFSPLIMLGLRVMIYTFFGSLSILYTTSLSSYDILKWLATKVISFYEWMFDFKLPNNVEVKEIHNAVSITPKSIYSSTLGYITSFRETYINPILGIEPPTPTPTPIAFTPVPEEVAPVSSSWWSKFMTPLFIVGSIVTVVIFIDYIPFTSDLIRKIPGLTTALNTIEYIPNTVGNWISSWFSGGKTIGGTPGAGDTSSSSWWSWSKKAPTGGSGTGEVIFNTVATEGPDTYQLVGRSTSLSHQEVDRASRSAGHFMHTYTPAAEDSANWSIGEGLEAIDLQSTGTTPTPSQIPTPTHTPSNSGSGSGFFGGGRI